jgi:hypothetical protein
MSNYHLNKKTSGTKRFSKFRSSAILGAVLIAAVAVGIFGFSESSNNVAASPTPQDDKKYVATKKIIVDRETKQPRKPDDRELERLVASLKKMTNRSSENLKRTSLSGGVEKIELDGRFASVVLARPNDDGKMEAKCVSTFAEGAEFLGLKEADSQN